METLPPVLLRVAALLTLACWTSTSAADEGSPPVYAERLVPVGRLLTALGHTRGDAAFATRTFGVTTPPADAEPADWERRGVGLLGAARLARIWEDSERALALLNSAEEAFEAADQGSTDETTRNPGVFFHRAIVALERFEIRKSSELRGEAEGWLRRQIEADPDGAPTAWARRILQAPETYAHEGNWTEETQPVPGDLRPPVNVFTPPPALPSFARLQGILMVRVIVDSHGSVAAVQLLKGLPLGLTEDTLRAVTTWLFQPATRDGVPVAAPYVVTLQIHL